MSGVGIAMIVVSLILAAAMNVWLFQEALDRLAGKDCITHGAFETTEEE